MNPDDLSERDRAHFDKLCEDKGFTDGDDSWKRYANLELDIGGYAPEGYAQPDDSLPAVEMPLPPKPEAPASLVAKYRAAIAEMSELVNASGACLASLRNQTCRHEHVTISESTEEIICKVCSGPIDVWWWARRTAREWGNMASWLRARRKETNDLIDEVAHLKRERDKLDAQIARRETKLGQPRQRRR